MTFKKSIIREILYHCDIVDVIGKFLPLKSRGTRPETEYVTLCPFHYERTPSFTVTRQKQFYHCFGCGAHGSAISFIREYTGITSGDAIKKVAELSRFRLSNGKSNPSNKKMSDRRKRRKKLDKKKQGVQEISNGVMDVECSPHENYLDDDIPF